MIAAAGPRVELHLVAVGGGDVRYEGEDGIREFYRDVAETWERFHFEGVDFRDLGDSVLILGEVRGRGRLSGADVEAEWACIVEVKDGRAVIVRGYLDHADALEAAGLGT